MKPTTKAMIHTARKFKRVFDMLDRKTFAGGIRYGRRHGRAHAWRNYYISFEK